MPEESMHLKEKLEGEKNKVKEALKKEMNGEIVKKPEMIDKVLAFDFSHLDTLHLNDKEQYMGAISQHMIYKQRYINLISIGIKTTKHFINQIVDQESLKYKEEKSESAREKRVKQAIPEIYEIENDLNIQESRLIYYTNEIENLTQLLQTIKKSYDADVKKFNEKDQ